MTRSRYSLAVLLQVFGIHRKMKRMTESANELYLMQDGEEILGGLCWKNVEQIDEISMEYWNLRRICGEQKELREQITSDENALKTAQQERALVIEQNKERGSELFTKREKLFHELELLNEKREDILDEAKQVKRRFEALQLKAKVLKDEGRTENPSFKKTSEEISHLKVHFPKLKNQLETIDAKISTKQEEQQKTQELIDKQNEGKSSDASEIYALISKANRNISIHRASLGSLSDEYAKHCRQIGRHLNINSNNSACRNACKKYRGLLEQVRLLRRSIHWNKKLLSRIGG